MKRRDFLKTLPLGIAATAIPFTVGGLFSGKAFGRSPALDALLNAQTDTNNILVIINLQGGNDGLNTVIPFNDPVYKSARRTIGYGSSGDPALLAPYTIRTGAELALALNPPLGTDFLNMFKDGKLAIVQNVGYADQTRSHFRGSDIWNTASDSNIIVSTGWMGRYLETQVPSDYPLTFNSPDPLAIAIDYSTTVIFQGAKAVMASAVVDPSKYNAAVNYADDTPQTTNAGTELAFVRSILAESDIYGKRFTDIFGTSSNPVTGSTSNKVAYPTDNPLAAQLQKVAWCINGGLKTRVYFITMGGYDTHVNQNSRDTSQPGQGLLHQQLGQAISLFQQDIEAMGFSDNVIGMTYSEFGRRLNENGSNGTDHGAAAPMFLWGKPVNGELYGHNPNLNGNDPNDPTTLDIYGDLSRQFDFRQVYGAILTQWFGANDSLRKAILNSPDFTTIPDFKDAANGFQFPVNGSSKMQNLITNPVDSVSSSQPASFTLYQNQPNPFTGITTVSFALSESGRTILEVFDSRGSLVATLLDGFAGRGQNQFVFDGRKLASGTYYVRLEVSGKTQTRQMMLVK